MKKIFKKTLTFICTLVLIALQSTTSYAAVSNSETGSTLLDILSSKTVTYYDGNSIITATESTEENYLKSLDKKNGSSSLEQVLRKPDEEIKYKTLTYTSSVANSSVVKTIIGVEVQYLFSNVTRRAVAITGVGNPYIRVAGSISLGSWEGSEPNVNWSSSDIRISYTGSVYVEVSASIGAQLLMNELWSLAGEVGSTMQIYGPVVTQIANFKLTQLY